MVVSVKCISELRVKVSTMPPKTRMVAEYIIDHPGEVITSNLQTLANTIGVSQFSILKCVREIGYKGYTDFKMSLAMGMRQIGPAEADDDLADTTSAKFMKQVFETNARALLDTTQVLDPVVFEAVVDCIFRAKRTGIYGLGYSAYAAQYLCLQLVRLGFHAIAVTDASYQLLDAVTLVEADLLFGLSASGNAQSIIEAFRIAKKNRCITAAVTCASESPLAKEADYTMLTTSSGPKHSIDTDNAIVEHISLASAIVTAVHHGIMQGRRRTI